MSAFVTALAAFLGVSPLRLAAYAAVFVTVAIVTLSIRQHYINKGYASAISDVKKQDDRSAAVAERVQKRADGCSADSWWDVISQSCKLGEAQ